MVCLNTEIENATGCSRADNLDLMIMSDNILLFVIKRRQYDCTFMYNIILIWLY